MIAQYDDDGGRRRQRRWSALAMAAVLMLGAAALTDSVRGEAQQVSAPAGEGGGDAEADTPRPTPRETKVTVPDGGTLLLGEAVSQDVPPRRGGGSAGVERGTRERGEPGRPSGRGLSSAEGEPRGIMRAGRAAGDAQMEATLARKLPEVNFDGVAFVDVIDFLRDVSGANIFVNWRALESMGIDRNSPVTMRMRDVSFGTVLRLLLESTAPGMLGHEVDGGVIIISVKPGGGVDPATGMPIQNFVQPGAMMGAAPAQPTPVTKVYDVRDLMGVEVAAARDDARNVAAALELGNREEALHQARSKLIAEGRAEGHREIVTIDQQLSALAQERRRLGSGGGSSGPRPSDQSLRQRMQELVMIVSETVGRDQPLSVKGFNTKLIVRGSTESQREVEQLLGMLREESGGGRETGGREGMPTPTRGASR